MSRLYYLVLGGVFNNARQSAPLQHVSVSGIIRDSFAEYTLVQSYVNPLNGATIEAAYTFPLYEGVAVSSFEAEVDGRKIIGKVQEKAAARKEYEVAVKEGKMASLLEQEKPDVFQASIGNIPPAKTITIRITLISEIKKDAVENQLRFVLPTTIAPRYGSYAPEIASSFTCSKLSMEIASAMSKQITSIQSPSHTIQVHLGTSPTKVSLTADTLLDRDLVIIVQAVGLDSPRALVEHHPEDGTHAVSLTFAPRFALNALKSCELIFLVDRSGSMQSGSQIRQAGEALELFLRSIPAEDHFVNIIGFGSRHQALFPKSVEYSAESLRTTTQYAQALRADMGGTELLSVFQEIFERRRKDVPTQIFLLTDGQIWDVEALNQCVKEAVEEGEKRNSAVRVFSLGVGAAVSHHLIESVARAGGGYSQLVVEGERMEKKVVNMLKAALMPAVTDIRVQWTNSKEDLSGEDDFEMVEAVEEAADSQPVVADPKLPISLFYLEAEVPSPPTPPPTSLPEVIIQTLQAPFKVPALYRGARFTIYAILSSDTPVPKEIILRGSSPDGPVELEVKVESVQEGETMLHSLAARTLVRDLEEGASYIHALEGSTTTATNEQMLKKLGVHVVKEGKKYKNRLSEHDVSKLTKQKILELALKYRISSKYTSWVAIDTESHRSIIHDNVVTEAQFSSRGARGGSFGAGQNPFGSLHMHTARPAFGAAQAFGAQCVQQCAPAPSGAPSAFGAAAAFGSPPVILTSTTQCAPSASRAAPAFGAGQIFGQATPCSAASAFGVSSPAFGAGQIFGQATPCSAAPAFGVSSPAFGAASVGTVTSFSPNLFTATPFAGLKMPWQQSASMESMSARDRASSPELKAFSTSPFGSGNLPATSTGEKLDTEFGSSAPKTFVFAKRAPASRPSPPVPDIGDKRLKEKATDPHSRLLSLLHHQQFDGLFPLVPEVAVLFSTTVEDMKANLGEFRSKNRSWQLSEPEWETLWATCLAVQFLRKQLPELQEEWELVVEKAEKRMAAIVKSPEGVAAMQKAASEMVKKD